VNTVYQSSYDITYAYWYTNDNCGVYTGVSTDPNMGYPTCRKGQQNTGTVEVPYTAYSNGLLAPTGYNFVLLTGLTVGTQYNYRAWIFWAWDSTYKLRVEAWDSTFTTQIFGDNVDTTNVGDHLNLTTSGTSGYFTIGTLRDDNPGGTAVMSGSGVQLDVAQVQKITP
jgi:hypothetical protein